jgi:hypothetical protein
MIGRGERRHREVTAARRVDDEIRSSRLRSSVALVLKASDRAPVIRNEETENPGAFLHVHVIDAQHTPSHAEFELWACKAGAPQTKVSLRKGVETGSLDSQVESDPEAGRVDMVEILLESLEKFVEDALSAGQKGVQMFALRDTRASLSRVAHGVPLQDAYPFEVVRQDARGR